MSRDQTHVLARRDEQYWQKHRRNGPLERGQLVGKLGQPHAVDEHQIERLHGQMIGGAK